MNDEPSTIKLKRAGSDIPDDFWGGIREPTFVCIGECRRELPSTASALHFNGALAAEGDEPLTGACCARCLWNLVARPEERK